MREIDWIIGIFSSLGERNVCIWAGPYDEDVILPISITQETKGRSELLKQGKSKAKVATMVKILVFPHDN